MQYHRFSGLRITPAFVHTLYISKMRGSIKTAVPTVIDMPKKCKITVISVDLLVTMATKYP